MVRLSVTPPGVVTMMRAGPVAAPAGVVTAIVEAVLVVMIPGVPTEVTEVAPCKTVPVTVTGVPPASGPEVGAAVAATGGVR